MTIRNVCALVLVAAFSVVSNVRGAAAANLICARSSDGALTIRERCRAGEININNLALLIGKQGPTGPQGPAGPAGADGAAGPQGPAGVDAPSMVYGDGSAGEKIVSALETLNEENPQFTDFTVNAGVTLYVNSGTVIRCTGTFTNNGTILVLPGAFGGVVWGDFDNAMPSYRAAERGVAITIPQTGEIGTWNDVVQGGLGAVALNISQARALLNPGLFGGSAGAPSISASGGMGGGSFVVMAKGGIVNSTGAQINADGLAANGYGSGGGGGGVVVLASPAFIAQQGTVSAVGGNGGVAFNGTGAGGGGGGGIINLAAPQIDAGGVLNVNAGVLGVVIDVLAFDRMGGGGGGACGGHGGNGTKILPGSPGAHFGGQDGNPGVVNQLRFDPTPLL